MDDHMYARMTIEYVSRVHLFLQQNPDEFVCRLGWTKFYGNIYIYGILQGEASWKNMACHYDCCGSLIKWWSLICFACRYRFVWVHNLSFKLTPCALDILPFSREGPSSDRQSTDSIAEIFGWTWYEVIEAWRLVDKFPWTTFSAKFQGLELCNGGEMAAKPSWVG